MTTSSRAAIAYIAGILISKHQASSVYDYTVRKYVLFSGDVSSSNLNLYDHTHSSHITGSGVRGMWSLYHYGESSHLSLDITGTQFDGYDYGTSSHFTGEVSGNSVTLYDYAEGTYFMYSI